ncbi:hypothetical protein DSECCO2_380760 [anaerobic digester metagenome]
MNEINAGSLKKAVSDLPIHSPGDFVWEEIRWQMDKPLSAELPVHPAPAGAWSSVSSAAGIRSGRLLTTTLFTAATVLFVIFLAVNYPPFMEQPVRETAKQPALKLHKQTNFRETGTDKRIPVKEILTAFPPGHSETVTDKPVATAGNKFSFIQAFNDSASNVQDLINDKDLSFMPFYRVAGIAFSNTGSKMKLRKRDDDCSPFSGTTPEWLVRAGLAADFPSGSGPDEMIRSTFLSLDLHLNRMNIATGIGTSLISNKTNLVYQYKTNELIFSYPYVDSVYYDPVSGQTYYFTTTVEIYDSVDHSLNEAVHRKYAYLDIPLEISYKIATARNLSLFVCTRGALHLIRNKKVHYSAFNVESSRLVSTILEHQEVPESYLSLGAGLKLEYAVNQQFGLQLEPLLTHHFLRFSDRPANGFTAFQVRFSAYYKLFPLK